MLVPRLLSVAKRLKEEPKLRRDVGIMGAIVAVGCAIGVQLGVDLGSVWELLQEFLGL